MSSVRAAVMGALALAACATSEEPSTSVTEQYAINGCPVWYCGSNSPEYDELGWWEMHELGDVNAQGFRIEWFRKGSTYYRPDVVGSQLVGRNAAGAISLLPGAVAGSEFRIVNDSTGARYRMRIRETDRTRYWARSHLGVYTTTYLLEYYNEARPPQIGMGWQNVCRDPGSEHDPSTMNPFHAVLFEEDRIDGAGKEVVGLTRNWFNVGCAGSALAKQHLTGHTKAASSALGITTTLDQRTANLKMITGDYCGTGEPFTVAGQPLRWRDVYGWYDSVSGGSSLEAVWTKDGAICLNEPPRVDYWWTQAGEDAFGADVTDDIAAECAVPPPCTTAHLTAPGVHVLSVNF